MSALVMFNGRELRAARYENRRIALVQHDGSGWAKLTTNLPEELGEQDADEVAIRDYSTGETTLAQLVAAGIVAAPHRRVECGHVMFPICRLLVDPRPL